MLISDAEHEMLQALADREGVTASDVVRRLVRAAHKEAFGEAPPKAARVQSSSVGASLGGSLAGKRRRRR